MLSFLNPFTKYTQRFQNDFFEIIQFDMERIFKHKLEKLGKQREQYLIHPNYIENNISTYFHVSQMLDFIFNFNYNET